MSDGFLVKYNMVYSCKEKSILINSDLMNISFSVIISLYNKEEYIGRAIESILAQTYQEFEIVVVDDCSTDEGPLIVESCPDDRIRLIRHSNNQGVSKTRNTGIANARY